MALSLAGRDLLSIADLKVEEVEEIWRLAGAWKSGEIAAEEQLKTARGRTLALLFDKSSLRTRLGFEVAMNQLGGHAAYFAPADVRIGKREAMRDAARELGRAVDAIAARLSSDEMLAELAEHSTAPVINAMSDREHPCQVLADLLTVREHKGDLSQVELAWVGDGYNVCHSLLLLGAAFGVKLRVATPATYEPIAEIVARAEELAGKTGASISLGNDPAAAVEGQATRRHVDFKAFQVNAALVKEAKPDAIVLHCLPAHRGEEVTDEVMEGPQCAAFDQAENRLHTQRALLTLMFA